MSTIFRRPGHAHAAHLLKKGQQAAQLQHPDVAISCYRDAIELLRGLPPERDRDILLAHLYLRQYQASYQQSGRSEDALAELHLGVSYARSTRDPEARALAEICQKDLDIAL